MSRKKHKNTNKSSRDKIKKKRENMRALGDEK